MRFPGFVQEDITHWVKNNDAENEETPDEQRHTYQPTRLLLLDGTLMVTLIDTKTDNAIWNGYASGVTLPEGHRGASMCWCARCGPCLTATAFSPKITFNGGNLDGAMNGQPGGRPQRQPYPPSGHRNPTLSRGNGPHFAFSPAPARVYLCLSAPVRPLPN